MTTNQPEIIFSVFLHVFGTAEAVVLYTSMPYQVLVVGWQTTLKWARSRSRVHF